MDNRFFVRDPESWQKYFDSLHLEEGEAQARVIKNSIVLPLIRRTLEENGGFRLDSYKGGICDASGNHVAGRQRISDDDCGNLGCQGSYPVPDSEIETRNERVLFGGLLYHHFGHTLIDGFARLWYPIDHDDFDKIIFLDFPFEFPHFYDPFEIIRLTGIDIGKCEVITTPTRFREVIVPDEAFRSFGCFRKEFIRPFDAIRTNVSSGTEKKIYLSRRAYQDAPGSSSVIPNIMFNEEWFEDFFARRGFAIKHPEQMSFADQVSMISGADEIVATSGTLTHLILFASPHVRVIALNRSEQIEAQMRIDIARNIYPYYVDATRNPLPTYHVAGPFLMAPNHRFKACLDQLGITYSDEEMDISDALPDLIIKFLKEWADVYRTQERAWMLGESTMFDEIQLMNELFYDDKFNVDTYREADRLRDTIRNLTAERDALCNQLNRANRELAEVYDSNSWKLTAPLRAFKDMASKQEASVGCVGEFRAS